MKKILKEWRSFVNETAKPHPTSYAAQTQKILNNLKKSSDMSMEEYLSIEAGYHIIRAIRGEPDKDGFMKKHKEQQELPWKS